MSEKFVEFTFESGEVIRVHFLPDGGMVAKWVNDTAVESIEFGEKGAKRWEKLLA